MVADLEGALDAGHACVLVPSSVELPESHRLDVVRFTGLLAALRARLYFRVNSRAATYSGAHWNPEQVFPYVLELDFDAPNRDKVEIAEEDWFRLALAYPCDVDPRTPAALPVIRALLHRVLTHEADESFVLPDGTRPFDPHEGLEAPAQALVQGALCL